MWRLFFRVFGSSLEKSLMEGFVCFPHLLLSKGKFAASYNVQMTVITAPRFYYFLHNYGAAPCSQRSPAHKYCRSNYKEARRPRQAGWCLSPLLPSLTGSWRGVPEAPVLQLVATRLQLLLVSFNTAASCSSSAASSPRPVRAPFTSSYTPLCRLSFHLLLPAQLLVFSCVTSGSSSPSLLWYF